MADVEEIVLGQREFPIFYFVHGLKKKKSEATFWIPFMSYVATNMAFIGDQGSVSLISNAHGLGDQASTLSSKTCHMPQILIFEAKSSRLTCIATYLLIWVFKYIACFVDISWHISSQVLIVVHIMCVMYSDPKFKAIFSIFSIFMWLAFYQGLHWYLSLSSPQCISPLCLYHFCSSTLVDLEPCQHHVRKLKSPQYNWTWCILYLKVYQRKIKAGPGLGIYTVETEIALLVCLPYTNDLEIPWRVKECIADMWAMKHGDG